MARKRIISPNIWISEDYSKLSKLARLIFIGMFSQADDYGYGRANPVFLKSLLFPYDEDVRVTDITKSLDEIAANMSVVFYRTSNGNEYYKLTNWNKWQKVDKPSDNLIPPLEDNSAIIRRTFAEGSPNTPRTLSPNIKEENKNKNIKEKEYKNISSELSDDTSEPPLSEMPEITLLLNTGEEYPIYQADIIEWTNLYPAVDVMQELREMKHWLKINPKKRKTKQGINRFIYNWLGKEQDSGKNKQYSGKSKTEQWREKARSWLTDDQSRQLSHNRLWGLCFYEGVLNIKAIDEIYKRVKALQNKSGLHMVGIIKPSEGLFEGSYKVYNSHRTIYSDSFKFASREGARAYIGSLSDRYKIPEEKTYIFNINSTKECGICG
ncbi:MAG: hypothetical protein LIO44_01385 [Eubacterium sp.]|nr:hypothetical protein [Eubacterium sp.]